jgi:hypothetical protein
MPFPLAIGKTGALLLIAAASLTDCNIANLMLYRRGFGA